MKALKPLMMSGREVWPLVEGGKGVAITTGASAGAWAAAGGIGTFSGANADSYEADGSLASQVYTGKTRSERHKELVAMGIKGAIAQARIAHQIAGDRGRIHMNILWEMGGTEEILEGALSGAKGMIHGVTCGAGMPYKLAEICARHGVYYYPIVSSARALRALWKRSYHKHAAFLGGVVYEDPWLAGGHNGLSNVENPRSPQPPLPRVRELRTVMRELGVPEIPIIMAGGVWFLREWESWLDDPSLGPVAFQFGTRPLLTKESPIPEPWKQKLMTLQAGDVLLHKFSPTGFYSSAVRNSFLRDLEARSHRQVRYDRVATDTLTEAIALPPRGRLIYVAHEDRAKVEGWVADGYSHGLKTPDETMVFVAPEQAVRITKDQADCMGCLSACGFSNWSENEAGTTGKVADPRSFCIQKTLQAISHGADIDTELMFAGHNAYRFADDPFYSNGFVPTVKELMERILAGD